MDEMRFADEFAADKKNFHLKSQMVQYLDLAVGVAAILRYWVTI